MGIKLNRKKKRRNLLRIGYLSRKALFFLKEKTKFRLFLDLEWLFNRFAHESSFKYFESDNHPFRIFAKQFILDFIKPTHCVLDLGCNEGYMSNYIADKAKKVVGVDYNNLAISAGQSKYKKPNLELHSTDAIEYLEQTTEVFDILILSHILEHLEKPKDFLNTFSKFFTYIYVEVPDFEFAYLNYYRKDLDMDLIYSDEDHISEFDRVELKSLFKACNMNVIQSEYRYGVQRFWCQVEQKGNS